MSMIRVISNVVIAGFKSVNLRHVPQRIRFSSLVTNDFHEWLCRSSNKIFSAVSGSLIDLKSAAHPWGSVDLLVFFVGVFFFVWVVVLILFSRKSPGLWQC